MPTSIEYEIRSRLEAFADELIALVKSSALELVQSAIGGQSNPGRRGRGAASVAALGDSSRSRGAKRDPNAISALVERLAGFIAKTPGKRIEEIGRALGVATKDLVLPVRKLIAARRVSTKGQRRATTYFAGGSGSARGGAEKKAPKSSTRKKGAKRGSAKRATKRAKVKSAPRAAKRAAAKRSSAKRATPEKRPAKAGRRAKSKAPEAAPAETAAASEADAGASE